MNATEYAERTEYTESTELDAFLTDLRERLDHALAERDSGFLTQGEFEDRLSDLELTLGADRVLEQRELRGGDTRFLLRSRYTGDVIVSFQLRRRF